MYSLRFIGQFCINLNMPIKTMHPPVTQEVDPNRTTDAALKRAILLTWRLGRYRKMRPEIKRTEIRHNVSVKRAGHLQQAATNQKKESFAELLTHTYLLWDVDTGSIDPVSHRQFVIERTLRYGFPEDIKLLMSCYDNSSIIEAVRSSRNLDRKTANFWAIHFDIPREEIRCFSTPSITPCFR